MKFVCAAARTRYALAAAVLLLFAPAGCKRHPEQPAAPAPNPAPTAIVKPAPPTPLDVKSAELGGPTWKPEWNVAIAKALPPALLSSGHPRDTRRFCPSYPTLSAADKRAFWAYFFEAIASAEAGLNPRADVHHTDPSVNVVDTETHLRSRQAGLLQLKYQDAARYGCNFNWKADRRLPIKDPRRSILQPENNLQCGVKILSRQVLVQGKPLITPSSYWEVLHPGTAGHRNFLQQMLNPPPACGLRATHPHLKGATARRETARLARALPVPLSPGVSAAEAIATPSVDTPAPADTKASPATPQRP